MAIGDIIGEAFGEILVTIIWRKIILPFFQLSGVGLRLLFNFKRKTKDVIYLNKDFNAFIGFFCWVALILTIIILVNVK